MPQTPIVFYQEKDGSVPALEWLGQLPEKTLVKCRARIDLLGQLGHELRRPIADYLRDDIYELRVRLGTVNYRLLYFFHGQEAVVLAHGLTKERIVPAKEIDRAIERKQRFEVNPKAHTYIEESHA